jgi:uncharacterized protein YlxW (UPF0749 family)
MAPVLLEMVYTNVSLGWGVEGQRGIVRMRRWGAWLVLVAASAACCAPARAQQMSVGEYQKKSAQAGKQQDKNREKQAKQQAKAQKKAQHKQAKQLKKDRAADAKANRQLQH